MKRKTIALVGLSALAGVALTSCGNNNAGNNGNKPAAKDDTIYSTKTFSYVDVPADVEYTTDGGSLNVFINYGGDQGITYRQSEAYYNPIEKKSYTQGKLLPAWREFAKYTKTTLNDVADYSKSKDDDCYKAVNEKKYKTTDGKGIDLFYNTTKNINTMGANNNALDLLPFVEAGKMPYFAKFLENNPTIKKNISQNGKIYYTPYFDGYNDIAKMFIMDTQYVKVLLDGKDTDGDTTKKNGGENPDTNVIQGAYYDAFMDATYNFAEDTEIAVMADGEKKTMTVKKTGNPIVKQNELLKRANGCTGQELLTEFKSYLKVAYADGFDKGYLKNLSDIFVSGSACYNADDMIALMRLVKANPQLLTGDANNEIEVFIPRGQDFNRVDNVLDLMQIWGIQGLTSATGNFFFGADNKLHSMETTKASYEALKLLSAVYDEGLILEDFYYGTVSNGKTTGDKEKYLDIYWKKTKNNGGYAFMMFDYSASTTASNDIQDGIGTDPAKRKIAGAVTSIVPVLAPVTWWANKSFDANQELTDKTGKSAIRHYEDCRTLKTNAWCIPATSENPDGAARLMDYMFSEKGLMIQDFGPESYWARPKVGDKVNGTVLTEENYDSVVSANKAYVSDDIVSGELTPIFSQKYQKAISDGAAKGKSFWVFMRTYFGNTHGIGHVRSKGIDIQAHNGYAFEPLTTLKKAIALDVIEFTLVDKVTGEVNWLTTVPSAGYPSITDAEVLKKFDCIQDFWNATKYGEKAEGWVAAVVEKGGLWIDSTKNIGATDNTKSYSLADVYKQRADFVEYYLVPCAKTIGDAQVSNDTFSF